MKAVISPDRHSVWPIFATASQHWWGSQSLYAQYSGLDMYRYSPTFAILITPLALPPLKIGGCLWSVGSVLLLYTALRILYRDVLVDRPGALDRSAFLILSAIGVAPMLWNLQSNGLVLALIAFGTAAVQREWWWRAAVALSIPVLIKLWPLAWVVLVAVGQPRRLGSRLVLATIALAAIPFLAGSTETAARVYGEWADALRDGQGNRWPGYRDLWTVFDVAGIQPELFLYRATQFCGGCLVLLITLPACRQTRRYRCGLAASLSAWICWQLLLGPGSEQNTYGLIVPIMAWETLRARRAGEHWGWPASAMAIVVLFSIGDIESAARRILPGATAMLPLGVLGFAAWLASRGIRAAFCDHVKPPQIVVALGPIKVEACRSERPHSFENETDRPA